MAGCFNPPPPQTEIDHFLADPGGSLSKLGSDTRSIESMIRDVAGSDGNLARKLVDLARSAHPRIRTAIAAGLAQAALACSAVDQLSAQLIQQAVAGLQDDEFQTAFNVVAGDLPTAATAAAASAAVGAVGSVVVNHPTGVRGGSSTDNPAHTNQAGIFAISGNLSAPNALSASNPVSPVR